MAASAAFAAEAATVANREALTSNPGSTIMVMSTQFLPGAEAAAPDALGATPGQLPRLLCLEHAVLLVLRRTATVARLRAEEET